MSIITIKSSNPDLSFILQKNPNTIAEQKKPFERELRKGKIYGWFTEPTNKEFRLLFLDSKVETSFSDREEFEYLDLTRYSNAYLPIMIITTTLDSAFTKVDEKDVPTGYYSTVTFTIEIPPRILRRFEKMVGFDLNVETVWGDHKRLTVCSNTVHKALNISTMICLVAAFQDEDTYVPLPEAGMKKYLNVLNRADAPYYMRHMFLSRAISNRSSFDKLKPLINTENFVFNFGDTQVQRFDAIKGILTGTGRQEELRKKTLIDIGCGEMYHSIRLSRMYESVVGFEADEDIFEKNSAKIRNKGIENAVCVNTEITPTWVIENESLLSGAHILLTEVVEHMDERVGLELVTELLKSPAEVVVITVPNKDFNYNYGMLEDEFRHPDHLWEPGWNDWQQFINKACLPLGEDFSKSWSVESKHIGDTVKTSTGPIGFSIATTFVRKTV